MAATSKIPERKRALGRGKFYQLMMRTRQPAGKVHLQLYVAMDDLSDQVGVLGMMHV